MSKTQSTTAKLSDTQLVILSAAVQRAEGSLLPFPQSLTVKGAALGKVVETLCKRKLAEERRANDGAAEWRRDEDGCPLGLFITSSGLLALGVEDAEKSGPSQAAANMSPQRKTAVAQPRRKTQKKSPTNSKRRSAPAHPGRGGRRPRLAPATGPFRRAPRACVVHARDRQVPRRQDGRRGVAGRSAAVALKRISTSTATCASRYR